MHKIKNGVLKTSAVMKTAAVLIRRISMLRFLSGANFLQNTTIDGNKSTYQTGYIIAGSLGYCWCYGLRLEAEYAFRRNAIKKIDFFGEGIL